jgi:hypothetical protein
MFVQGSREGRTFHRIGLRLPHLDLITRSSIHATIPHTNRQNDTIVSFQNSSALSVFIPSSQCCIISTTRKLFQNGCKEFTVSHIKVVFISKSIAFHSKISRVWTSKRLLNSHECDLFWDEWRHPNVKKLIPEDETFPRLKLRDKISVSF